MLMFALGFLACYIVLTVTAFICDKTNYSFTWFLLKIIYYICFPFVWLICWPIAFFKNLKGVTHKRFEWCQKNWADTKFYHLFKNIYLLHDPKATKIFKHWFLVRVLDK